MCNGYNQPELNTTNINQQAINWLVTDSYECHSQPEANHHPVKLRSAHIQSQFQTMKSYQQKILTLAERGWNINQIAQSGELPQEIVIHVLAHYKRREYGHLITKHLNRVDFDDLINKAMFVGNDSLKEWALNKLRGMIK